MPQHCFILEGLRPVQCMEGLSKIILNSNHLGNILHLPTCPVHGPGKILVKRAWRVRFNAVFSIPSLLFPIKMFGLLIIIILRSRSSSHPPRVQMIPGLVLIIWILLIFISIIVSLSLSPHSPYHPAPSQTQGHHQEQNVSSNHSVLLMWLPLLTSYQLDKRQGNYDSQKLFKLTCKYLKIYSYSVQIVKQNQILYFIRNFLFKVLNLKSLLVLISTRPLHLLLIPILVSVNLS